MAMILVVGRWPIQNGCTVIPRWFRTSSPQHCSKAPGWLFDIGDEKLPNYMGMIIGQYKDPYYKPISITECTLPKTNMAPKNGWLEYDRFLLGWPVFRGYVSFRECNRPI